MRVRLKNDWTEEHTELDHLDFDCYDVPLRELKTYKAGREGVVIDKWTSWTVQHYTWLPDGETETFDTPEYLFETISITNKDKALAHMQIAMYWLSQDETE